MDVEEKCAAAIIIYIITKRKKRRKCKKQRSIWVKPWLNRRNQLGFYDTIMNEFRMEDTQEYKKFLRLPPSIFDELLEFSAYSCFSFPRMLSFLHSMSNLFSYFEKNVPSRIFTKKCSEHYIRLPRKP